VGVGALLHMAGTECERGAQNRLGATESSALGRESDSLGGNFVICMPWLELCPRQLGEWLPGGLPMYMHSHLSTYSVHTELWELFPNPRLAAQSNGALSPHNCIRKFLIGALVPLSRNRAQVPSNTLASICEASISAVFLLLKGRQRKLGKLAENFLFSAAGWGCTAQICRQTRTVRQ
jgi:hypothetical protein